MFENREKKIKFSDFFRAIVGEMNEEMDASLDLDAIKAEPLHPIVH
jgi:hypothetical protein